jgi:hypothetical protein
MKVQTLVILCVLGAVSAVAQPQPPQPQLVPYSPNVFQDKKGNEWYIEQNGALQRNGGVPSLISSAMMLHLGTQQFYAHQPLVTQDGSEITATSPQPMNGVNVTRRITILEREGALRYVEEFANTTMRDLALTVELRHGLNNPSRTLISDTGRPVKDGLQSGESGILVPPNQSDAAPSVLLSLCSPGSQTVPRVSARSGFQISVFYNLNIPPGQTAVIVHGIAQAKVGAAAKGEEVAKAFQPISMRRLTKGVPKQLLRAAANVTGKSFGMDISDWNPGSYWGIEPESSDLLMLDDASRLKGRIGGGAALMKTAFGEFEVKWDDVAAYAGPGFTGSEQSWLWLRDGQRWRGMLEPPVLKFVLMAGAELELPRVNRLILRRPLEKAAAAEGKESLLEMWSGERIAFQPEGSLKVDTPWGPWSVPWTEVLLLGPAEGEQLAGLLHLRDGTRLRVLPSAERVTVLTKSFGSREVDFGQLRRAVTAQAATVPEEAGEPVTSFLELPGDQRLVGRVTTERLRFLTQAAPVELAPAAFRDLHESEEEEPSTGGERRFQAELWGGGRLAGTLANATIAVEGRGYAWQVPLAHITRIANPVPIADNALLRRTAELIQTLGDAQWQKRESAQAELKELGVLAKASLQEALKQSTDAEVTRRLETLLAEME